MGRFKVKNIFVLTRLFPDDLNSIKGIFVENLLNNQALDKRFNFLVNVPIPYTNYFISRFIGKKNKKWYKHTKIRTTSNFPIYYTRYLKLPKLYVIEWVTMLLSSYLFIKKNKIKVDIIHTHWLYPDACAAIALAKMLNVKVVVHNHEAEMSHHTDNKIIKKYLNFLLRRANLVIPVSDDAKIELIEKTEINIKDINIEVIHNGVDITKIHKIDKEFAREKVGFNKDITHFITVATLKHKKGVDIALRALAKFNQAHPDHNFEWHIIGEGDQKNELLRLAKESKIDDKIIFYGNLPYNDICFYMNAADYFVLPSRHESFGIVFLEALICGIPVLGTKVGGIPEFVTRHAGILIDKDDVNQCYQGIINLINSEWDYGEISSYYSTNYSLDKFSKYINDIYLKI